MQVPGTLPGNYHLIVRADVLNQEKEGSNETNNVWSAPFEVRVPELVLGVPQLDRFLHSKDSKYYRLVVSNDVDLKVSLNLASAGGSTELYIRREAIPTRSEFDAKYNAPLASDQSLRIPGTLAGTYYLLAYADTLTTEPTPFFMRPEASQFEISGFRPKRGGNRGNVTVCVTGASIPREASAQLVYEGNGGIVREVNPIYVRRTNTETLFATFNLEAR